MHKLHNCDCVCKSGVLKIRDRLKSLVEAFLANGNGFGSVAGDFVVENAEVEADSQFEGTCFEGVFVGRLVHDLDGFGVGGFSFFLDFFESIK